MARLELAYGKRAERWIFAAVFCCKLRRSSDHFPYRVNGRIEFDVLNTWWFGKPRLGVNAARTRCGGIGFRRVSTVAALNALEGLFNGAGLPVPEANVDCADEDTGIGFRRASTVVVLNALEGLVNRIELPVPEGNVDCADEDTANNKRSSIVG